MAYSFRGTNRHLNGFGLLGSMSEIQNNLSEGERDFENPPENSTVGLTVNPVVGSIGGRISKTASTLDITNQILVSAMKRPGQILQKKACLDGRQNWEKLGPTFDRNRMLVSLDRPDGIVAESQ